MEGRWGRLILHAFRTGQLDFKQYRRDDAYWTLREGMVLDDLESEFRAQVDSLTMMWHSCAGQSGGWEDDGKRAEWHEKEARKAWNDVGRCLLPWYDQFEDERPTAELWAEFQERGKDPAYAEYLRRERQRLRDVARQHQEGSDALQAAKENLRRMHQGRRRRG